MQDINNETISQHRNTQLRRHAIMQPLQEQGEVSVEQLVQLFDTSGSDDFEKISLALEKSVSFFVNMGGAILMPQEIIEEEQMMNFRNES